jgi:hypothetical protein
MNEILLAKARLYAARRQLDLAEELGSGKDGIVLVGKHKTNPANGARLADVAVKIHRFEEAYLREKRAYQRLSLQGVTTVEGFNVPELIAFDDVLLALEMTIVKRPFVVDFAAAHLDRRPDFPEEVWAAWEEERREHFEQRWPTVQKIMAVFEVLGVYLTDVSPGNIGFLDQAGGQTN